VPYTTKAGESPAPARAGTGLSACAGARRARRRFAAAPAHRPRQQSGAAACVHHAAPFLCATLTYLSRLARFLLPPGFCLCNVRRSALPGQGLALSNFNAREAAEIEGCSVRLCFSGFDACVLLRRESWWRRSWVWCRTPRRPIQLGRPPRALMACTPRWRQPALLALAVLVLASSAQALFVIEKGALKIKFPRSAATAHRDGFDVSMANFGSPKYGGELMCGPSSESGAFLVKVGLYSQHDLSGFLPGDSGKLVYPDKEHGHENTCVPGCNFACQSFSVRPHVLRFALRLRAQASCPALTGCPACRRKPRRRSSSTTRRSLGSGRITSCLSTGGHVRAVACGCLSALCAWQRADGGRCPLQTATTCRRASLRRRCGTRRKPARRGCAGPAALAPACAGGPRGGARGLRQAPCGAPRAGYCREL